MNKYNYSIKTTKDKMNLLTKNKYYYKDKD